jgi:hypothetical protein
MGLLFITHGVHRFIKIENKSDKLSPDARNVVTIVPVDTDSYRNIAEIFHCNMLQKHYEILLHCCSNGKMSAFVM